MFCLASIKIDSTIDKEWKKDGVIRRAIFKNEFKLIKDIYVCSRVRNLLPLLRHDDVEVLMSGLSDEIKRIIRCQEIHNLS